MPRPEDTNWRGPGELEGAKFLRSTLVSAASGTCPDIRPFCRVNRRFPVAHRLGIGMRLMPAIKRSAAEPAASSVKATATGDIAHNPCLIHQYEHPQMAPRTANHASRGDALVGPDPRHSSAR